MRITKWRGSGVPSLSKMVSRCRVFEVKQTEHRLISFTLVVWFKLFNAAECLVMLSTVKTDGVESNHFTFVSKGKYLVIAFFKMFTTTSFFEDELQDNSGLCALYTMAFSFHLHFELMFLPKPNINTFFLPKLEKQSSYQSLVAGMKKCLPA